MTDVSYTARSGLRVIGDGRSPWGDDARPNWQAMDYLLNPERVFLVSPEFTAENLQNDSATSPRRFSTIQAAITAWEAAGFGDGQYGGIYVYPGRYNERLAVTKSVALIATHRYFLDRGGAARGVFLRGDGDPDPVISFAPPAGEEQSLVISGFSFTNEATAQGSIVAKPMILDTIDQGGGNYGAQRSLVVFEDCNFRLNTTNLNSWLWGVHVRANHWAAFKRCRFTWPAAVGGLQVINPFYVNGNSGAGMWGHLSLRDCEVNHGTAAPGATVYKESGASGQVVRCTFNRDFSNGLYGFAGSGQLMLGLNGASDAQARGNLVGVNVLEW